MSVVLAAPVLGAVPVVSAGLVQGAAVLVFLTISNVLPASFVYVGSVRRRARGSAYQGLNAI